jgi:DNA invertase Pin-like site-specific DNA recombinase
MLVGYVRISNVDNSQVADLQRDALRAAGVDARHLHEEKTSGKRGDRPGLAACLKTLREGDTLVVYKLDRLGGDLRHLVNTVHDLTTRGIGFKVLAGQGAGIDTTSPNGKFVLSLCFAALAEFDRELIAERFRAGMAAGRARGRPCGRRHKMTATKLQLIMAAMCQPETRITELCAELRISRTTLYRHIGPDGLLREDGRRLLSKRKVAAAVPAYLAVPA